VFYAVRWPVCNPAFVRDVALPHPAVAPYRSALIIAIAYGEQRRNTPGMESIGAVTKRRTHLEAEALRLFAPHIPTNWFEPRTRHRDVYTKTRCVPLLCALHNGGVLTELNFLSFTHAFGH
jgi:hypothetical protein